MFKILQEQIAALQQGVLRRFEIKMADHLKGAFAEELRGVDVSEVRALVRYGIQRAQSYGITLERDVCFFLRVAAVRGRDFDVDPSRPWVRYMLTRPSVGRVSRIEAIHDAVMLHRDKSLNVKRERGA